MLIPLRDTEGEVGGQRKASLAKERRRRSYAHKSASPSRGWKAALSLQEETMSEREGLRIQKEYLRIFWEQAGVFQELECHPCSVLLWSGVSHNEG